jgi:integrase
MIGQPAKVLRPGDVRHALAWASRRRHGLRNRVIILLSVKAGLRAGEIAALRWSMVGDATGGISKIARATGFIGQMRIRPKDPPACRFATGAGRPA